MQTLVFRSDDMEKIDVLIAMARALKVPFETVEEPYDPKFVAKIMESRKQFEKGDYEVIEIGDIWK